MTQNTLNFSPNIRRAAILLMIAGSIPTAAFAQTLAAPPVPTDIQVPEGNVVFMKAYAEGTQNYVCLPSATGLAWKFQGPQATLYFMYKWFGTEVRQQIMTHFLSPSVTEENMPARATWQSSIDTSAVWAKKTGESVDPAFVTPGAIPWFRLEVTGAKRGPTDGAIMMQTSFIQRIKTTGGATPITGCSEAGAIAFVPYTAEYVFYRPSGSR